MQRNGRGESRIRADGSPEETHLRMYLMKVVSYENGQIDTSIWAKLGRLATSSHGETR